MTATVPPYPVADSPHTDLAIRELYARVAAIETAVGITTTPDGDVVEPTVRVSTAVAVQMANKGVRYDDGWFNGQPYAAGDGPQHMTYLDGPGVVLSMSAYLVEWFPDTERELLITHSDDTPHAAERGFWGRVLPNSLNGSGWLGS